MLPLNTSVNSIFSLYQYIPVWYWKTSAELYLGGGALIRNISALVFGANSIGYKYIDTFRI